MMRLFLVFWLFLTGNVWADSESIAETGFVRKRPEDSIPVIEIRGEGKPMTPAQIRSLEEISNGGPLDIKIEKTWVPPKCPHAAKRLDFVTFHYKGFLEDGKKFDQTYGRGPIKVQLGTGMIMPGLDKGLRGICESELRKISVPYRLSRKQKSKVWKYIPNDEHWLAFSIEILEVNEWTLNKQFIYMDSNNDSFLTENELITGLKQLKSEYGKKWRNEDIDNVLAVRYYIKYFDANHDNKVDSEEFERVMQRDLAEMEAAKAKQTEISTKKKRNERNEKSSKRGRDPGVAWILDFDNDGVVSYDELDSADQILQEEPKRLPIFTKDEL